MQKAQRPLESSMALHCLQRGFTMPRLGLASHSKGAEDEEAVMDLKGLMVGKKNDKHTTTIVDKQLAFQLANTVGKTGVSQDMASWQRTTGGLPATWLW